MINHENICPALELTSSPTNDVKTRSWLLFNVVVGGGTARRPRCLEVADDLEWLVSTLAVEPGHWLGAERDLARRFAVGRRVMRQACRSLVARGTIVSRRGKAGGYLVACADKERALDAFGAALAAPEASRQAQEALAQVGDLLRRQSGSPAAFALAVLERVAAGGARPAVATAASLAEAMAHRIEEDLSAWLSNSFDDRSGVLEAMSEHYDVSLHLIVQAVRLLEDSGVLQLKKGRLGGIVPTAERASARAIRAAHAHFATHSTAVAHCDRLVRMLNIALIERATGGALGPLASIEEALGAMRAAREPTAVGMHWFALQRALSERAANAPLHLLVKCLAAYVVRFRTCRSGLDEAQARTLVDASERIVANIRAGRARGNAEAHIECQEALRVSW